MPAREYRLYPNYTPSEVFFAYSCSPGTQTDVERRKVRDLQNMRQLSAVTRTRKDVHSTKTRIYQWTRCS